MQALRGDRGQVQCVLEEVGLTKWGWEMMDYLTMKITESDKSNLRIFVGTLAVIALFFGCLPYLVGMRREAPGFLTLLQHSAGLILILLVCVRLGRMAFHHGKCDDHDLAKGYWTVFGRWWGVFIFLALCTQPQLSAGMFIGVAVGFVLWTLPVSAVAWLWGRLLREDATVEYYFKDHDLTSGPFTLEQLRSYVMVGTIERDDLVCRVGSETWMAASAVMDFDKSGLKWLNILKRKSAAWMQNAGDNLRTSNDMNYRIFIPSVALALLLGALLHWGFAERYRFQAMGSGKMMKTDRWSGKAWMAYGSEWIPVRDAR